MQRPSRLRRWLKWASLLAAAIALVLWAASTIVRAEYVFPTCYAVYTAGGVGIMWKKPLPEFSGLYVRYEWERPTAWLPRFTNAGAAQFAVIPLWIPIFVLALPATVLFWQDRHRIPPGHCQKCGYDLTGNVSGRCPECGDEI